VSKSTANDGTFFYDLVVPDLVEIIRDSNRRTIMKAIMMDKDNARSHNSRNSPECFEQFHDRGVSHLISPQDIAQATSSSLGL
jgi:hypothetical protein